MAPRNSFGRKLLILEEVYCTSSAMMGVKITPSWLTEDSEYTPSVAEKIGTCIDMLDGAYVEGFTLPWPSDAGVCY